MQTDHVTAEKAAKNLGQTFFGCILYSMNHRAEKWTCEGWNIMYLGHTSLGHFSSD